MKRFFAKMVWMAFVLGLGGCRLYSPDALSPARHDLGPWLGGDRAGAPHWSVDSVEAPVWMQDERIRYRFLYADPTQPRHYLRDRWSAPPAELLAHFLDGAGGGGGVRLRLSVLELEHVFAAPGQARLLLALKVRAYRAGAAQPLAERRFLFDEPTSSADAAGAVAAFSRLAGRTATEIRRWLEALPGGAAP